ncbi:piggyBac transposable element-derived protein 4-like [Bactrocera tryoni]|uniref:piggyBac transposable element-derived protein 4-like n=1 Tax=Bactrocera tryoni TaxID=59916 RepID=UPI001A96791D|nr:piggyBac transposable element-derived protein 4-like [Bactrocera tryoni]
MSKKSLSQKELERVVESLSDFSAGSSDEYEPSEDETDSSFEDSEEETASENENECEYIQGDFQESSTSHPAQNPLHDSEDSSTESEAECFQPNIINRIFDWFEPSDSFRPAKTIPLQRSSEILIDVSKQSTAMEIFHKLFPHSLYLHIVACTNQRLELLNKCKGQQQKMIKLTDKGEMQKIIGCMLIMSYNKLPGLKHYWSQKESMGNRTIENCISRDRYMVLTSKLYFSQPNKPPDATKSYYVDDLISCLKHSFSKCRQDSPFQSIDESMTKFKGRSSLKQYMPLKPIKRGIKLWLRCDADSGYTYDFNVYVGKGTEVSSDALTLGEKVVKTLVGTIKVPDVVLCFDRFFTSVNLLETINFAAVGTCMTNRKNVPSITGKLKKGESKFRCTDTGLMCTKWQDTKEVLLMSNCHKPNVTKISKKDKTGQTGEIDCPEAIAFYRQKWEELTAQINS